MDVFQPLAGEGMFQRQEHLPTHDDPGHHVLGPSFDDIAEMEASVCDDEKVFIDYLRRRVIKKGNLDVTAR